MKTYKVLETHIGDDPLNPYVPGDQKYGTRTMPASEAKTLIEMGLLAADDDHAADQAADVVDLETADQFRERHQHELDRAAEDNAKLTDQVRDTCARAEKAEAELAQLREADAGASAAAAAANARIADLEAQLAAARAGTQAGSEKAAQDLENKMQPEPVNKAAAPKRKAADAAD